MHSHHYHHLSLCMVVQYNIQHRHCRHHHHRHHRHHHHRRRRRRRRHHHHNHR